MLKPTERTVMLVPVALLVRLAPLGVAQNTKREKREGFLPYSKPQVLQPESTDSSSEALLNLEAQGMLKQMQNAMEVYPQRLPPTWNESTRAVTKVQSSVASLPRRGALPDFDVGNFLVGRFSLIERLSHAESSHPSIAEDEDTYSFATDLQDYDYPVSLAEDEVENLPKGITEKYKIPMKNFLGAGNFGEAWLATDKTTGTTVVVKLFKATGEYVGGSDKVAFDRRGSTGEASEDDEDEDSESRIIVTKKMSNQIADMKHECDIARDIQKKVRLVEQKWRRYRDRLVKCVDGNTDTPGLPVFVALTYGGRANLIKYIEIKLEEWRHENGQRTLVEYQEHQGKRCDSPKFVESDKLEDALERCSKEGGCLGILSDETVGFSGGKRNKVFSMCFGASSDTPSSLSEALSASRFYEAHRGQRAISLRKKVLVADLFGQFLESLSLLEALGLTHHDLKITNAVVDDKGLVHLIDYGAMSYWGNQCSTVHTWNLTPPEFIHGTKEQQKLCDRHYDVWAVANVLLQMVQKSAHAKTGASKASREPFLSMFCDAKNLTCVGERPVFGGPLPTPETIKGFMNRRKVAYADIEYWRQHGMLNNPLVAKTVDEVFLRDEQFKSFIDEYFTAALDANKNNRPSFQETLTSSKWFAPLRRKPGSGGTPMKIVQSIPYSVEDYQ